MISSKFCILFITLTITLLVMNSSCQENKTETETETEASLQLSEVKVNLGDPCNFALYQQFVLDTEIHNISYALTNENYTYKNDLKSICIEVSADSVVDAHKYDCILQQNRAQICGCGYNMYKVDPLWSPPDGKVVISGVSLRTYVKIIGLDRRLVLEKGKCLSGTHGHCTTNEKRAADMQLRCREKHRCQETAKKIENQNSSEWYWTCEIDPDFGRRGKGAAKSITETAFNFCILFFICAILFINQD